MDGFTIKTDKETFNTSELVKVERMPNLDLIITLESRSFILTGRSALQAWVQINETSSDIETWKAVSDREK